MTLIAVKKEQTTDPDSPSMESQDHSDLGNQQVALVPVPRLPMLHTEGQESVVILRTIATVPETRGIRNHRRADQRSM